MYENKTGILNAVERRRTTQYNTQHAFVFSFNFQAFHIFWKICDGAGSNTSLYVLTHGSRTLRKDYVKQGKGKGRGRMREFGGGVLIIYTLLICFRSEAHVYIWY